MEWMFPLWVRFWGQYSLLFQYEILEKLVTCIETHAMLRCNKWWTLSVRIKIKTDFLISEGLYFVKRVKHTIQVNYVSFVRGCQIAFWLFRLDILSIMIESERKWLLNIQIYPELEKIELLLIATQSKSKTQ